MSIIQAAFRNWRMLIGRLFPGSMNQSTHFPELCLADIGNPETTNRKSPRSLLEDIIGNGFLWAVPKKRRSLERRMTRRMGFGKLILPRNNVVVCNDCGHFHLVHTVCGNCYEKVKEETKYMQEAVFKELKLDPINKEVVILYENDRKEEKLFEGKRIVEVPKERPQWFSKNLLMKDSGIPRRRTTDIRDSAFTVEVKEESK
ncbi:hypothetical protein JTE90_003779 [Oedothorax gibbosus]|uniref:Large ribosomal subunit protein bL32m n=1 Tax=Oedothorax gibbosus TaxID=931172 RepID=A0AAV6VB88_9ARAC|nr:hypothetical protein JTE90_003779 [Oedothorax gibbosus]